MKDHPALVALPPAYLTLFPPLRDLDLPLEHRTDCAGCPQVPPEGVPVSTLHPFMRGVRCCTYQPWVPNFLVGRALVRGGRGAELIRARMHSEAEGVEARGIRSPDRLTRLYAEADFGTERALRCPFVGPEPLTCSIWPDRNGVCRTWHCRTSDGARSVKLWTTVRNLLTLLESKLGLWLVEQGAPPEEGAPPEQWVAWYRDCHLRLEAASPEAIAALPFPERRGLEVILRVHLEMLFPPLPDRVLPVIRELTREDGGFRLRGYSPYDRISVPTGFMALYGELVAAVPWREALDRIEADYGVVFDEAFMEHLWRRGLFAGPTEADQPEELKAWLRIAEREGFEVGEPAELAPPEIG